MSVRPSPQTASFLEFSPLVGRGKELRRLHSAICQRRTPVMAICGPSGIGKTALVTHFAMSGGARQKFQRVWFQSLYRTTWTAALADLRRRVSRVLPANATVKEIEEHIVESCRYDSTLIVLDNIDEGNVAEVSRFLSDWQKEPLDSSVIVTAQPDVIERMAQDIPTLTLEGLQTDSAILDMLGDLMERFAEETLLEVGNALDGNPQKLLFLNWIQPEHSEGLRLCAENLNSDTGDVLIEDFVLSHEIPALFLLALGVHRDFIVTDRLLAFLWDHFAAQGTHAYAQVREDLIGKKILLRSDETAFRLHESLHLQMEKALLHRVGSQGIPAFHHYLAEFYEAELRREASTTNLTHFIHHSLAANRFLSALRTVIDSGVAHELATKGSAVLVRQELQKLDTPEIQRHAPPLDQAKFCLRLGSLCNDLSEHESTLRYMERARNAMASASVSADEASTAALQRQAHYYSAVSFSNLGQSDDCLREYFEIVNSSTGPGDSLACLSLGYLAADLKYRDLPLALEMGQLAVDWARAEKHRDVLSKNICSHAESLVIAGDLALAVEHFGEAAELVGERAARQRGRIETNLGFALARLGDPAALQHLDNGHRLSASMGDRRRLTQALLYKGIAHALAGDRAEGERLIGESAALLCTLRDGRFFAPAFCWTLQLQGATPIRYPTPEDTETAEAARRMGQPKLYDYAVAHPEFALYHEFWWRYLEPVLRS